LRNDCTARRVNEKFLRQKKLPCTILSGISLILVSIHIINDNWGSGKYIPLCVFFGAGRDKKSALSIQAGHISSYCLWEEELLHNHNKREEGDAHDGEDFSQ
jgi:hypothetical protein